MIIFPTMQLMNGRCVTLRRGRTSEPMIWHVDPIETARGFAAAGASWMHITDIDAVKGDGENRELILELVRQAGIPVQIGGGIRSVDQIAEWVDHGAGRLVVGTLAALDFYSVQRAARLYPDQISVTVDVWKGDTMTHGWLHPSAIKPLDFVKSFDSVPLASIIVTDIDANIGNVENTFETLKTLAAVSTSPVIASGVVRTRNDIERLKQLKYVSGAIVGDALFNKTITVEEALEAAQPRIEDLV